ncbi:MAG TPA: LacI family DNA-binding transcriptional regulator [Lacunisphaera sp.]|nr:LacI family DNA-binding transcriptional regulator [Lacunisphaera sp.]
MEKDRPPGKPPLVQTSSYELIARAAQVSRSTVSRVMRNDDRISAPTAARVREAARQLGYRPNPLLATLMERIRNGRKLSYQGTIGVLTEAEDATHWYGSASSWRDIDRGATRRAAERGYRLEYFSTKPYDHEGRRLSQILRTRDIHGLYVAPGFSQRRLAMQWEHFSAATTGYGLVQPSLHRVCYNNYHGVQLACQELRQLGYRRIGLYMEQRNDEVTDHNYLAGFLLYLESVTPADRVRPVRVPRYQAAAFKAWFEKTRPDAVISSTRQILDWAREVGVRSPEEFGFVHLDHHERVPDCAGINHNSELIGEAVIDLIVAQIHRGETGVPPHPMTTVVEGYWVPGPSAAALGTTRATA